MLFKFICMLSVFCLSTLLNAPALKAEEIYFKNGDKISGSIQSDNENMIVIEHPALGVLSIEKKFVERVDSEKDVQIQAVKNDVDSSEKQKSKAAVVWENKISLGYNETGGNTENSQASASFSTNRKTGYNEWTGKGDLFYASSEGKMNAQKSYGLLRYAYSFGESLKWYRFYKTEGSHDRFANIDYRLTPSTGLGYWFSDEEDWKLMTEIAVGFEHTNYRGSVDSDNEAILIPRLFLEKRLWQELTFSQDITLYPSLTETGEYRFRSETKFVNPVNEKLSWNVRFIDEYNSNSTGGTKKNDYRLISGLEYMF